jgi:hypothetical protein
MAMSALPNKYVSIEYSVFGIAAQLISELRPNDPVSSLWDRVRGDNYIRTFDRFAEALTLLYAGGVLIIDNGLLYRRPAQPLVAP